LLVEIIAKTIERIALLGIEKILSETLFKKEEEKENAIRKQNTALKQQIALQAILAAVGGGGGISFFNKGGSVSKNQPVIVGDSASGKGGELFVPNSSGQIIPNSRLGSMGGQTNVNFTIHATDVKGVKELLIDNRATIVNVINSALNEKGKEAIV
jgi:hypothetical protein